MAGEFDVPGLSRARMALTALAKTPKASHACNVMKKQLVKTLYAEIRAARIAGYPWKRIHEAIRESRVEPRMSVTYMVKCFCIVDKEYERETGVKALPQEPSQNHIKKRKSREDAIS